MKQIINYYMVLKGCNELAAVLHGIRYAVITNDKELLGELKQRKSELMTC
jgi:rRNA-processing protein FCF1